MNMSSLAGLSFLIAASSAAALAQTPLPPPAPAPVPAPRTETLRLKFPVGQTLYYSLTEDTVGSYLEPHGKLTSIKSHLEMQEHQTVTGLRDSDNAGLIAVGIDSLKVTVDGKPVPPTDASLATMADLAKLAVLPNGKIGETLVNPALNVDEALTGEDPAHMNAPSGLGELPDTPLKIGDKWKSTVFLGMIGEQTTADLSLTGWETKDAASIAVINQVIHGKFGTPTGDMAIMGRASGTRTVRLNVEAGTVDSEDSLVYMGVMLTPKAAPDDSPAGPTRMWIKVTSKLVQTAAPVPKTP